MLIDTQLLDSVSAQARQDTRLRKIHPLHHSSDAPSQRMIHAMEIGVSMPIHRHRHMDQSYILMRGKLRVMFYNQEGDIEQDFILDPLAGNYGLNIPQGQWHCLEVLEAGSVLFEANDGPEQNLPEEDIMPPTKSRQQA